MSDSEQHFVLIKRATTWARQAREAMDEIRAKNGGTDPVNLRASADVDQAAFASLIEAMVALESVTGRRVDAELISLAGLKLIDQVI